MAFTSPKRVPLSASRYKHRHGRFLPTSTTADAAQYYRFSETSSSSSSAGAEAHDEKVEKELQGLKEIMGTSVPPLLATRGKWTEDSSDDSPSVKGTTKRRTKASKTAPTVRVLRGLVDLVSTYAGGEVFVTEASATAVVLGKQCVAPITATVTVQPLHPDSEFDNDRKDLYFPAYVLTALGRTKLRLKVTLSSDTEENLSSAESVWVTLRYVTYGPRGRIPFTQHSVLPLGRAKSPPAVSEEALAQPIPTHLLFHGDDPIEVVRKYALPHAQPGRDVVAIAETALALMQGRYRHPDGIKPGLVARVACRFFLPTSSLATCNGMQTLVDLVGAWRVALAVIVGVVMRAFGQRGWFYKVAGPQSSLIDDVTGAIPPYDQFVCLGPKDAQATVDAVKASTGLDCAVVDVNDLSHKTGSFNILAHTQGVDLQKLTTGLLPNPAGNADQQTPLVIVRRATLPPPVEQ